MRLTVINLKKLMLAIALTAFSGFSFAQSYSDNFTNVGTEGYPGGAGFFFFIGDNASQTFSTGLTSVDEVQLQLNLGENGNYASQDLGLTLSVNGTDVGSTTYSVGDQSSHSLDFTFGPLASGTGDWTLDLRVTTPVCSGCGAVQFGTYAPMTLISNVPEPETYALMLAGLGFLGFAARRRKNS
jgi:hypothetical protein